MVSPTTSPTTILHPNNPSSCSSTAMEFTHPLLPPTTNAPPVLDFLSTSPSTPSTSHNKKRRVKWVGLLDDWPLSSPNHESDSGTGPTSSHSDHQQHQQHPQQANPSLTPSSSASFSRSRPFSLPTLEQFSQQISSQRARSTRPHLVHLQQDSDSRENSTSSLALSTNLNTRANSSSAHTPIPNSVNPYFPSILPQQPSQSVEHQTAHSSNLNSYRNNLLRSQSSRLHSEHITSHHRDSYLPTPTTPMATPDQSRPGTPDSDLDIPFGERDGLPSNPNRKPRTFTREAANLVSLHKFNMSAALGRGRSGPSSGANVLGKRLGTAASHNATVRENRTIGAGVGLSSTGASTGRAGLGISMGNGVLSSLLHLYNHPTSAQSSSATLINYGSDEESDAGDRNGNSHNRHLSAESNQAGPKPILPTLQQQQQPDSNSNTPQGNSHNEHQSSMRTSLDAVSSARHKITNGLSRVAHRFDPERPATARSKAGVFGALQASAMGLGGVAAPSATGIAPAAQKSGFRLARYTSASGDPSQEACPMTLAIPTLTLTSDNPYGEMAQATRRDDSGSLRRVTSAGILMRRQSEDAEMYPTPSATREGPDSFVGARLVSSASSSVGSIFKTRIHKSSSMASLKALGDAMKPTNFHNESAVLKAKRTGSVSGSTPGTPAKEFFGADKSPIVTPLGLPPQNFNSPYPLHIKAHQHNQFARRRREKRRQEEIFITMHVAAILQRQQFILQLTRALMMFGGPSHRLESQVLATARVLEIDLQVVLIYSICIFSFQDEATHTSETKFIKQSPNVDLGKLTDLATLHWEVVHDKIGVQEASQEISRLMRAPPEYKHWQTILIGSMCSAFIGPAAFSASFLDVLISAPLGAGLVAAQLFVANKSDVLSQIFEIVATGFTSFVAAGLASTGYFCYSAVIASSIVLILPGWLVCCAALELQSRSIVSGSVRLIWAVIYALFLGLGISVGAEFWTLFSGKPVLVSIDGTCGMSHTTDKWYRTTIPLWSTFIVVPAYALFLAMRQHARLYSKEIWVMVILASGGFTANHFASLAFPNRSDISSALGSFIVGFLANIYGRLFQGTSFIVALVPILFQLPSGLGNGGLLYFANTSDSSHSFTSGFQVGQQLLEVSLGLVIGLFVATVLVYPFGNRRGGLMAF
ncbi:hypothetical protein Pst134EA_007271 [Puccinia striiformis f. sp. tritici]|uniref:hypothetical protein n=1 Tax=Puccinia striiformis f. sp. tritici TaxID=168172 RepID=UPI002007C67C|nr:hypothetical protein Pst134EA_007271 [Puccinia striiformis f. sp. tritici]KAH9470006.1 hypothetical protein Pst134EA_007271 [Puccinia striiformis f. sp. tritici]